MPKFRYTAIDAEGNQKTGRVSAGSEEQAQEKLETLGYFVQELSVETRGAKASRTKDIRRRSQDFSGDADEGKTKKKKKRSGRAHNSANGEVAEWTNVPDSKSGVLATVPWVRIPPSPPLN